MTTIQAVIQENRRIIARMKDLNLRVGREVFLIPTREQIATGIAQILGGVARLASIEAPEALRLPVIDPDREAEALRLAPDTILVCGREFAVEYRAPSWGTQYPPRVRVDFLGELGRDWLRLPEEGVYLPDGREVTLCSVIDGHGTFEAPSS